MKFTRVRMWKYLCKNGIASALAILQSCNKPSIYAYLNVSITHSFWIAKPLATQFIIGITLGGKTSYHQISWSLEAARLDVAMVVSLWHLTGTSAAVLPRYLPNFRAIGKVHTESRGFETSRDLAVRRLTAQWIEAQGRIPPVWDPFLTYFFFKVAKGFCVRFQ